MGNTTNPRWLHDVFKIVGIKIVRRHIPMYQGT